MLGAISSLATTEYAQLTINGMGALAGGLSRSLGIKSLALSCYPFLQENNYLDSLVVPERSLGFCCWTCLTHSLGYVHHLTAKAFPRFHACFIVWFGISDSPFVCGTGGKLSAAVEHALQQRGGECVVTRPDFLLAPPVETQSVRFILSAHPYLIILDKP